jgi:dinuclear metal center YbgI/SA1388 family protein
MASLNSIVRFLNAELRVRDIPDASRNGLQVRVPKEIRKIGFAVDGSFLIVHHGIKWKGLRDRTGLREKRIDFLKRKRINLYAAHLPLDLHPEYGNNIELARILGLTRIEKFGKYKGRALGFKGRLSVPRTIGWIAGMLGRRIKADCKVLGFGRPTVRTVGIVSGGGSDAIGEAYRDRLDCFVTGEAPHHIYHEAKDLKKNVIIAGHYATEITGVKALMPLLKEEFGVRVTFLDVPATT